MKYGLISRRSVLWEVHRLYFVIFLPKNDIDSTRILLYGVRKVQAQKHWDGIQITRLRILSNETASRSGDVISLNRTTTLNRYRNRPLLEGKRDELTIKNLLTKTTRLLLYYYSVCADVTEPYLWRQLKENNILLYIRIMVKSINSPGCFLGRFH